MYYHDYNWEIYKPEAGGWGGGLLLGWISIDRKFYFKLHHSLKHIKTKKRDM